MITMIMPFNDDTEDTDTNLSCPILSMPINHLPVRRHRQRPGGRRVNAYLVMNNMVMMINMMTVMIMMMVVMTMKTLTTVTSASTRLARRATPL